MNKRKQHRIVIPNLKVEVASGAEIFLGTVNDVSQDGILLNNIPDTINKPNEILSIIVISSGQKFKMLAMPRWVGESNLETEMGVEIIDAPIDWTEFVKTREPKGNHSWTAVTFLPDS